MDWYNYSMQFIWSSGTNPIFDKRAFARLRGLEVSMCREYPIKKEPSEKERQQQKRNHTESSFKALL